MTRPLSIIQFERCYLGALVLGMVNLALSWSATRAQLADNPATAQVRSSVLVIGVAIGLLIPLLLWYFAARRGAVVAKWIIVGFFVLGVITTGYSLALGSGPGGLPAVIGIVTLVLNGIAAWLLFRPDAERWFGEGGDVPPADTFA